MNKQSEDDYENADGRDAFIHEILHTENSIIMKYVHSIYLGWRLAQAKTGFATEFIFYTNNGGTKNEAFKPRVLIAIMKTCRWMFYLKKG